MDNDSLAADYLTRARLLRDRLAAQRPDRGGYHLELALARA